MSAKFDNYDIDMARFTLIEVENGIEKAQSYVSKAGFTETMTIPSLLVRLLRLNRRIVDILLDYLNMANGKYQE